MTVGAPVPGAVFCVVLSFPEVVVLLLHAAMKAVSKTGSMSIFFMGSVFWWQIEHSGLPAGYYGKNNNSHRKLTVLTDNILYCVW